MLTPNGPRGRGSIPALVMRSGLIREMAPSQARADLELPRVLDLTVPPNRSLPMPTGQMPQLTPVPNAPPSATATAVAATMLAAPPRALPVRAIPMPAGHSDRHAWPHKHRRGHPLMHAIRELHPTAPVLRDAAEDVELGEWRGRPMVRFEIASSPPQPMAEAQALALTRTAGVMRQAGLHHLPAQIVGGPLAALLRGGAVELHFQNGVVVRTAL